MDTVFWTITNANDGTTTQASGAITLSTNTTANGSTIIQSNRRARYTGGSSNRFRAQIQLGDNGITNNSRKWGIFDGTDGAYFELDGTSLYIVTLKGGSPTRVASENWNSSTTTPTLTNVNAYEIYITNSRVYFVINGILVHAVVASAATWTATMNLPVRLSNTNSSSLNVNKTMLCRVATIYRLGNLETQPTSVYQAGTTAGVICKYGAGNLHGLIISGIVNNAVVTLYDNFAASGTVLWSSGAMSANTTPFSIDFHNAPFSNGLTLVIGTANCNVLVIYE